jgi:hypothetical protein
LIFDKIVVFLLFTRWQTGKKMSCFLWVQNRAVGTSSLGK